MAVYIIQAAISMPGFYDYSSADSLGSTRDK